MSVCTRGKGGDKEKQRVGLVGVGLALVRFVIAKRCFRCGSSLLSSHKRKKIVCVEVSPQQPIPGHPHSNSLPVPPLGAPLLRASPPPPHPISPRGKQKLQPLYFPTVCNSAAAGAGTCWLRFLASSCAGWLGEAWAWLAGHWLTVLLEDWDG